MSALQLPTLQNVRIHSARDAHQIFYAVARRLLPMTVRRLDAEERRAIAPGNCYVWEERGANSEATGLGIERWTDGMRWSPSRVRDDFLFYHQKESDPDIDIPNNGTGTDSSSSSNENGQAKWARMIRPRDDASSSPTTPTNSNAGSTSANASPVSQRIPHAPRSTTDPDKLIKQTYSVQVSLPHDRAKGITRKWHLTAYFTTATLETLSTVEEELGKRIGSQGRVQVPEGWFKSARTGKTRRERERYMERDAQYGWAGNGVEGQRRPGMGMYDESSMMGANGPSTGMSGMDAMGYAARPPRPISFVEGYAPAPSLSVNTADIHPHHSQSSQQPQQQYSPYPVNTPVYHSNPHSARHQHVLSQHQMETQRALPLHDSNAASAPLASSPIVSYPAPPMPRLPPPPSATVTHSPVQYSSSRLQIDARAVPISPASSQDPGEMAPPQYMQHYPPHQHPPRYDTDGDVRMSSPPPSPSPMTAPKLVLLRSYSPQYGSGPSLLREEPLYPHKEQETPSPLPSYSYPPPKPPTQVLSPSYQISSTAPAESLPPSGTTATSRLSPPLIPQMHNVHDKSFAQSQLEFSPSHVRTRTNSGPYNSSRDRDLVPLNCLQSAIGPRRDPTDDLLLRQFGSLSTSATTTPVTVQAVQ